MLANSKIAIVNPSVAHYREGFYRRLKALVPCDVFTFESPELKRRSHFKISDIETKHLKKLRWRNFLYYNVFPLLSKDYGTLVLMWDFGQISTWFLLITKIFHRKKIILWGQGISVKRYLTEEKTPNRLLKFMLTLADGAWVYMEKEANQWKRVFPLKSIVSLNNTISDIEDILCDQKKLDVQELKKQYKIKEKVCLIFCARFENPYRRTDILEEVIRKLDMTKFGFIIIGDGKYKPDFTIYPNVYDFGTVYNKTTKDELFTIADIYFQPGWVGLSVVEAFAYGKPAITFKRSNEVLQCVEYGYIEDNFNGLVVESIDDLIKFLNAMDENTMKKLGLNARRFAESKLKIETMVNSAVSIL